MHKLPDQDQIADQWAVIGHKEAVQWNKQWIAIVCNHS